MRDLKMATSGKTTTGAGGKAKPDTQKKSGGQGSGGNFANDREKASEAGKKGGAHSSGGGKKS
ncbi:general stress protein [Pseudomonas fluorescens]|jgi:general stress protein YciG|uniref:General stress protein n=2 Tax=Pseudomonas aylmerensis TaxID=1869229 RepID=A0A2T4FWM8_9PSED|nr:general stress protein [Pseudomonas fluorescens]MBK5477745.1 general stress protein [Pseudomonas sp. TH21]MBS7847261.1 general stress protein [Pseudomonas fluorescens]PTC27823.1 general stress protein [Pseudomonas aylmerensis]QTV16614.1 general stress protein [Pseudomonas fluorescens]